MASLSLSTDNLIDVIQNESSIWNGKCDEEEKEI